MNSINENKFNVTMKGVDTDMELGKSFRQRGNYRAAAEYYRQAASRADNAVRIAAGEGDTNRMKDAQDFYVASTSAWAACAEEMETV